MGAAPRRNTAARQAAKVRCLTIDRQIAVLEDRKVGLGRSCPYAR